MSAIVERAYARPDPKRRQEMPWLRAKATGLPACEPQTYSVARAAAGIPAEGGGGGQGLRLDHCGPTLDQAVSQAARRRLLKSARASRRAASSASAIAASVITATITSPVRAEGPAPTRRAPARPCWPNLGRSVIVGACWRAAGRTR